MGNVGLKKLLLNRPIFGALVLGLLLAGGSHVAWGAHIGTNSCSRS